ncbi:MAG TPA: hypothetical protein VHS28_03495 [Chloroflexota bacterium]|nr:hypothetical protein [Chloroflexota bacterium]
MPSNATALRDLQGLRDKLPEGLARETVEKVIEEPHMMALAALMIAARMGSNEEWDSPVEYLEGFAYELGWGGLPSVGDQDQFELEAWRRIADAVGMNHDGEEDA